MKQSDSSPCVAVTGATGLIGRHLCRRLSNQGWRVRGLVRDPERLSPGTGVEYFRCDLPDQLDPAGLEGADVLIHAAYATRNQEPDDARRVNELGSQRLFELARRQGVGQIVFLSSFSSRPDALSYYGRSKYAVEGLLDRDRDLALRAGLVLAADGGLFCRIVRMLRRARLVPLVGGSRIVQTLHIADLCHVCQRAIEGKVTGLLHAAEPRGEAFHDLLRLVLQHLRRRCVLLPVPFAPVWAGLRLAERLGVRLGVNSDNLLGIQALRPIRVEEDLARLGVEVRPSAKSVAALMGELICTSH
ncbi:MAG TPA: NAD(P)-dependent oxidoreductase [Pirellulales bacterium]|nr:NAD(P)-dependent oxidoreductase [Pirellulales bacterium]